MTTIAQSHLIFPPAPPFVDRRTFPVIRYEQLRAFPLPPCVHPKAHVDFRMTSSNDGETQSASKRCRLCGEVFYATSSTYGGPDHDDA